MGFLKLIGAVSAAEHEAFVQTSGQALANSERDLKKAEDSARRMANDRNRIAAAHDILERERKALQRAIDNLNTEIAALRPDAEAMRKKRRDDVARVQAKRDAAKGAGK